MKILIADDQQILASLLQDQVRAWGYDAQVVPDGFAALQVLRAPDAPRLALLDWVMPGLDGIEVCRRLRRDADRQYTYLVLATGYGGRQEMLDGLEAGADDFLSKPIDPAELKARLGAGRRIVTLQEQLREQAIRDGLTGLYNRSAILATLESELARSLREGRPLGVVLADIDHFKRINDTHGHLVGDAVLREVACRLRDVLRPYDSVGRYGGEEFLLVLPGCDGPTAAGLAERLRQCVAAETVSTEEGEVPVALSLGVAAWEGEGEVDTIGLLRSADEALYSAKRTGRNRTVLAPAFARLLDRCPS
jgi:two-component system cell cycle response regulator